MIFLLAFIAFWIGMILIAIVGIKNGDPYRLVYATDYEGVTCGKDAKSDTSLVYFPRINKDIVDQSGKSPVDMSFYGICVKECPASGTYICNYDTQKEIDAGTGKYKTQREAFQNPRNKLSGYSDGPCWYVPMEMESVFFRCLPKEAPAANTTERCKNPNGGYYGTLDSDGHVINTTRLEDGTWVDDKTYYYLDQKSGYYKPKANCAAKEVEMTSISTKQGAENPLMDQLATTVATVARWGGDVSTVKMELAICGLAVSMVLCFLYLFLLKKFGGCIIWSTIYIVIIGCITLSFCLAFKAGMIGEDQFAGLSDQIAEAKALSGGTASASFEKQEKNQTLYKIFAWISIIVTLILFIVILFMRKNVRVAIAIMQEASAVVGHIPVLIAWPLIPYCMLLVLLGYWVVVGAYIYTTASVSAADFSDAAGDLTGGQNITIQAVETSNLVNFMSAYHLFGLLWTNQLIQAISMCTIAGAGAEYYWTRDKSELSRLPVARSFYRVCRYHLGSLAFGALIIAIIQFVRICLEYLDKKTKNLQASNFAIKLFMKAVKCCLCILEKVVKYISRNAYIVVAMKGKSFCSATVNAFKLLFANIKQIAITAAISSFMLLLGKIAIAIGCTVILYIMIEANSAYKQGGLEELSSPMMPVFICFVISWFIATSFMNVYGMTVDTLLLCYCEDRAVNKEGTYFMSDRLLKAINVKPSKTASDGEDDADADSSADGGDSYGKKATPAPKANKTKAATKKAPKPTSTKVESFDAADVF